MEKASFHAGYRKLYRQGDLQQRGMSLWNRLKACDLCPRNCGINRLTGDTGYCEAGQVLKIASFHAHFGEERPLVGQGGSGTIFFSHCNLGCVFCQNWDISHKGSGEDCSMEDLAEIMLELQAQGCENINLVTPTHYSPHILLALERAASRGLYLPLVWNTSGWERADILSVLDGVVDIYLADFKLTDSSLASRYFADAGDYPLRAEEALSEMHRQVGVARIGKAGLISRGLMIRHLVMPGMLNQSLMAVRWISGHLPADTYVNIMSQYRPCYHAHFYPEIDRPVSNLEYMAIVREARALGLHNLDVDL